MAEDRHWRPSLGAFVEVNGFAPRDWTAQLAGISRLDGRGHVEIWFEWLPEDRHQLRAVLDVFADETVLVHAPFIGLSLGSPWRQLRHISIDRIVETCAVADGLGAQILTVHSGVCPSSEPNERTLDRIVDSYEEIIGHHPGVRVNIENMSGRSGGVIAEGAASLDACMNLIDRVPGLGLTLDVGHAIQNGENYADFLAARTGVISNIHLHDAYYRGPAHLKLGDGELSVAEFVRTCIDAGYGQFVGLETIGTEPTTASWLSLKGAIGTLVG